MDTTKSYYLGPPERRPGKHQSVSQKIDIWSFGCVFSIAATWVAGGYSLIQDFTKVRKKAVANARANGSAKDIPDGDLFHDGKDILSEIGEWHRLLRDSLRQTDHITGQILDVVDEHMFVADLKNRIDCRSLCGKLQGIIKDPENDLPNTVPILVIEALLEVDEEASRIQSAPEVHSSVQKAPDSSGNDEVRKKAKSQALNMPPQRTAQRSEYLASVLASSVEKKAEPKARIPENLKLSTTRLLPPTKRSEAPQATRNFFQMSNEIRHQGKKYIFSRSKNSRFPDIIRYFQNRDIVSALLFQAGIETSQVDISRNSLWTMALL